MLCLQVLRKNRKLLTTIKVQAGGSRKEINFQLDTGASCNILNLKDYTDLDKPKLDQNRPQLRQFDGSVTRALGGCSLEVAGRKMQFLVHKTRNQSLLSMDACLELGLITVKEEWVNLVSEGELEDVLCSYKDVFEGMACLPG